MRQPQGTQSVNMVGTGWSESNILFESLPGLIARGQLASEAVDLHCYLNFAGRHVGDGTGLTMSLEQIRYPINGL